MTFSLFEVAGIELEYMIVEKESLNISSIADRVLADDSGVIESDRVYGPITWSNELAAHVIELKTTTPISDISSVEAAFAENITKINQILAREHCMLLPTAAHPFMDPRVEGNTWAHEGAEIYSCYQKLFDIRSHGWLNLQSVHLNLPFNGDREFARLHTAIRLLLPLLPALAASSPFLEGKATGVEDSRLKQYLTHQLKLRSSMGLVIPDVCESHAEYYENILAPIERELQVLPDAAVLQAEFLNARGAIARFGRGSIEIRLLDIGEAPAVDLAICSFIIELLKSLVYEEFIPFEVQKQATSQALRAQLDQVVALGKNASLRPDCVLLHSAQNVGAGSVYEFMQSSFEHVRERLPVSYQRVMEVLVHQGCVAHRILARLGDGGSRDSIRAVYRELADCLQANRMFL